MFKYFVHPDFENWAMHPCNSFTPDVTRWECIQVVLTVTIMSICIKSILNYRSWKSAASIVWGKPRSLLPLVLPTEKHVCWSALIKQKKSDTYLFETNLLHHPSLFATLNAFIFNNTTQGDCEWILFVL